MNPTADHQTFRSIAEQGKISVGVDPAVARRLFTDPRMSSVRDAIGEPIPLERGTTFATFYLAPVCLIASFHFGCQLFGWWIRAVIPVSTGAWVLHQGRSSIGRPGVVLWGLAVASLIWLNLQRGAPIDRWLVLLAASLFLTRIAYRLASGFFRLLVIRNAKAYDLLREAIYGRE